MSTTRCIPRPAAGWAGKKGFTTDYHRWAPNDGPCIHCHQTRNDVFWAGLHSGGRHGFGSRPPEHETFSARPDPRRWVSVQLELARRAAC